MVSRTFHDRAMDHLGHTARDLRRAVKLLDQVCSELSELAMLGAGDALLVQVVSLRRLAVKLAATERAVTELVMDNAETTQPIELPAKPTKRLPRRDD